MDPVPQPVAVLIVVRHVPFVELPEKSDKSFDCQPNSGAGGLNHTLTLVTPLASLALTETVVVVPHDP
jgi:hypothetical protein